MDNKESKWVVQVRLTPFQLRLQRQGNFWDGELEKSISGCGQTGSRGGCGEKAGFYSKCSGRPLEHFKPGGTWSDLLFRTLRRLPGGIGRWEAGEEPAGGGSVVVQFLTHSPALLFASWLAWGRALGSGPSSTPGFRSWSSGLLCLGRQRCGAPGETHA